MKRKNKTLVTIILAFFMASGLNLCLLFLPAPVMAAEKTITKENASMPCHGKKMGQMEMVHEEMARKKFSANHIAAVKSENKKTNTVLPCCENHDKGSQVDMPREKNSFLQIQCPIDIIYSCEPQAITNTSEILVVDLPPPEAGLIASTFKRE